MAIYTNSYSVTIKTLGGTTVTANDATIAGVGASAWACIQAGEDVQIQTADGYTFVPFHAIDSVTVTITRSEAEEPEDETCVVESEEDDG